jgi:2-oxoglutarate dehydrogenase E2 component (dihydrolipoamide succinyltransferase)
MRAFSFIILTSTNLQTMPIELVVPPVGESITEVQLSKWLKREGDRVERDENLCEIETDKATVELPAPAAGVISQLLKGDGETAAVGEVIGYMEEGAAVAPAAPAEKSPGEKSPAAAPAESSDGDAVESDAAVEAAARAQAQKVIRKSAPRVASPRPNTAVKAPAPRAEAHVEPAKPLAPAARSAPTVTFPMQRAPGVREEEAVPMSPIRRRIAERLVQAQQTAALLTTFNEVDMSAVMEMRKQHQSLFQEKYGIKLGFMSFFIKATIEALKLVPAVNAEIRGTDIVYHNYYDIGIAVGGGKGLVVPVLRDADRLSFAEIELAIADLARRARDNSLSLDELQGGTFTISNGGVYGSMLSTPIVNPPQSGILGLHAIQDRVVPREGQVVIRPMMYLALTYDHRIVDGQGAVTFLKRIKDVIEQPLRMLVEI